MPADASPFVPSDDWLDAFETQATPEMFEQVLVYAQTCENRSRIAELRARKRAHP